MKLGLDSFSFQIALAAGTYDIFRTLDTMEAMGLSGLQININGPNGRFLGGAPADKSHVRRVRRALERKGFFVEIGGMSTRPDMLDWQLRLCGDIGADVFRTLLVFQGSLDATFEQARRDLEQSLPLARTLGVRIALENHEDVTAAELRRFLDLIGDPDLGACLDTGNDLVIYGDPLESASLLAPCALTTHINDQKLVRHNGTVHSVGVPLGTGDVDLPAILSIIRRQSPLGRLLIQDTIGYSAPLNPFQRADLVPRQSYAAIPECTSVEVGYEGGLLLSLDHLAPEQLQAHAVEKAKAIERDVAYVRNLLDGMRRGDQSAG